MTKDHELVAVASRAGVTESWHHGSVAVVRADGELVASAGAPDSPTFMRSAAKPVQALPLLLAGGRAAYSLEPADVALICASHGGTPDHVMRAESLLHRGDFDVTDLLCGSHWPLDLGSAETLRAAGETASPLHNNCSGKHAGMLLACRLMGWPTRDYLEAEHPLQVQIRRLLAEITRESESMPTALDGCSAPTFHLPLRATARLFAVLAAPEAADVPDDERTALTAVAAAMTAAPEMVAGPGRFTTRLMEVTNGRVLGKEGAEGLYGVAVRDPEPLGVAVKIADGSSRSRDGVVLEVLRQLGALSTAERDLLEPFRAPERRNCRERVVGRIEPVLELGRA